MLFTDARALHANDLVVINIEEVANASRSADTNLCSQFFELGQDRRVLGAAQETESQLDRFRAQHRWQLDSALASTGSSDRSESFTATVPAVVMKVLPNGNLFVEGHRAILVNSEEHHFYISGVVRPIDIDQLNSIKSSVVADAQIEFVGRGDLTDNQKQGWLSRYLGWIWPF